jgi:CBS domain containing-hemolysin-like protein
MDGTAFPARRNPVNDATFTAIGLAAVVLLVAANGLFVATEFAFVAVRQTRVEQMASEGVSRARALLGAIRDLDNYIAATQLGITLSSLALGWVGEPALAGLIEPPVHAIGGGWASEAIAHTAAVAVAFTIITGMHIVLGELAPKSVALAHPEGVALWVIVPIAIFNRVFKPFIWAMNHLGRAIVRPFGIRAGGGHTADYSPEELELVIEASARAGLLSASELSLARRALDFGDIQAHQLMVPRTELVALDSTDSFEEVIAALREHRHTRYPVYEGDLDHIIGILEAKDLAILVASGRTDWRSVLRPAVAIPEGVSAEVAVATMRTQNTSAVVVVDEHGGTSGILSGEEFLTRVLGLWLPDVSTGEAHLRPLSSGNYLVSGLTLLDDLEDELHIDIQPRTAETIGGHVMDRLGRVPTVGDRITIGDYEFRVVAMDRRRVDRLLAVRQRGKRTTEGAAAGASRQ